MLGFQERCFKWAIIAHKFKNSVGHTKEVLIFCLLGAMGLFLYYFEYIFLNLQM